MRVLTLKELPSETQPLLLKGLFEIGTNFQVVSEWRAIDNSRSRKDIFSRRRHHHNTKTSFLSNIQDQQNRGPNDDLVDDSKQAAVQELGECLKAIGDEGKYFGDFTLSAVLYDKDEAKVEEVWSAKTSCSRRNAQGSVQMARIFLSCVQQLKVAVRS